MARYQTGDALLAACRAGRGAIVIVEGESDEDDAWIFKQWFGAESMRLTFIPQNGWREVMKAVALLRQAEPHRQVHGIRDRDFTSDADYSCWEDGEPEDGVFILPRSCLESYLLDPPTWLELLSLMNRGTLPDGWGSPEEVGQQVEATVVECLSACAFNRVVHEELQRQSEPGLKYMQRPLREAGGEALHVQRLEEWGHQRGAPHPLRERFEAHVSRLESATHAHRLAEVGGKMLLRRFLSKVPQSRGSASYEQLVTHYVQRCADPPEDIRSIVRRILGASSGVRQVP